MLMSLLIIATYHPLDIHSLRATQEALHWGCQASFLKKTVGGIILAPQF